MHRRIFLAGSMAFGAPLLSGCASPPRDLSENAYCYHAHGRPRTQTTCAPLSIPSLAADEAAKRFAPVPGQLVVYVVRHRVGDTVNTVHVGAAGDRLAPTVPASMVRLVMPPGSHRLLFDWKKGAGELSILGSAGQVLFVELVGDLWLWSERYRLVMAEPSIRHRALISRLVADLTVGAGA